MRFQNGRNGRNNKFDDRFNRFIPDIRGYIAEYYYWLIVLFVAFDFYVLKLCLFSGSLDILENSDHSQGNEIQPDDFIDQIIRKYLKHNLSLVCLEDFMELFNVNREMCDKLPTKKKQIMKLFSEHRDLIDIIFFMKCNKCQKTIRIKSDNDEPAKCCDTILKKCETNFFIYLPIEKQLLQSIRNNWLYIKDFDTNSDKTNSYSDVHDGEILKSILNQYKNDDLNILSLCLNVDGANKFKSNKFSLWPIQFTQNFLPPRIRFQKENIIVAGLYYTDSDEKLNFRDYMLPLVHELNELKDNHITMNIEDQQYSFKPVITHCCVDLPAKSKLQETKQFGGYDACTYCEIPGELIVIKNSNSKKKQNNVEKKPREFVRYVEGKDDHPLRDETETLKKMLLASSSSKKDDLDGIKGKQTKLR